MVAILSRSQCVNAIVYVRKAWTASWITASQKFRLCNSRVSSQINDYNAPIKHDIVYNKAIFKMFKNIYKILTHSDHQRLDCLFKRLFRRRSEKP